VNAAKLVTGGVGVVGAQASCTATPAKDGRTPIASMARVPRFSCTVSRLYYQCGAQCTQSSLPSTRNPVSSKPATGLGGDALAYPLEEAVQAPGRPGGERRDSPG
jgi:hypothetical protein